MAEKKTTPIQKKDIEKQMVSAAEDISLPIVIDENKLSFYRTCFGGDGDNGQDDVIMMAPKGVLSWAVSVFKGDDENGCFKRYRVSENRQIMGDEYSVINISRDGLDDYVIRPGKTMRKDDAFRKVLDLLVRPGAMPGDETPAQIARFRRCVKAMEEHISSLSKAGKIRYEGGWISLLDTFRLTLSVCNDRDLTDSGIRAARTYMDAVERFQQLSVSDAEIAERNRKEAMAALEAVIMGTHPGAKKYRPIKPESAGERDTVGFGKAYDMYCEIVNGATDEFPEKDTVRKRLERNAKGIRMVGRKKLYPVSEVLRLAQEEKDRLLSKK
jgi:hypothetical protein